MASTDQPTAVPAEPHAASPWIGIAAGIVAAAVVWGGMQAVDPVFQVHERYAVPNLGAPAEMFAAHRAAQNRADRHNAMLYLAALGGLTAGALVLAQGRLRPSLGAALGGVLVGAAGGVLGGFSAGLLHEHWVQPAGIPTLLHTLSVQAALLAPTGIGVGLAFGLSRRSHAATAIVGGVVAGLLAGVLYPVAVSFLLPNADTSPLLPREGTSRLLWMAMFAVLVGGLIPAAGKRGERERRIRDGV
jgi:hypothetical protein